MKKMLIIFFTLLLFISVFVLSFFNNKNGSLETNTVEKNKSFAIMLQNKDMTGYVKSLTNSWPSDMILNEELTNCMDAYGNYIDNPITFKNGIITVKSNKKIYCYLYFDIDPATLGESIGNYLIDNNISGLQKEFIGEDTLYRFSGTTGNNGINNYICLGTQEKCIDGSDNMYRIIGIEPSTGAIKVIKQSPYLSSTIYTVDVGSSYPVSQMSSKINNDWLSSINFSNLIQEHEWDIDEVSNRPSNRQTAINSEKTKTTIMNVGILALSDYYLAYDGDQNWTDSYGNYASNWIHTVNNGGAKDEWTMTPYSSVSVNHVMSNGTVHSYQNGIFSYKYAARPTFYLKPTVKYVSGDGTIDNPFIVNLVEKTITLVETETFGEYLVENKISGLQQDFIGDDTLYRFSGTFGNNFISNYICLGVSEKCSSGSDDMYRIIGVEPSTWNVKVIKETLYVSNVKYNVDSTSTWNNSSLWSTVNSNWLSSINFADLIQKHSWNSATVSANPSSRKEVINAEDESSINGYIGILSLSDYYLAYREDQNWTDFYNNYANNWIHIINNGGSETEWTMTPKTSSSVSHIMSNGTVHFYQEHNKYSYSARPTFYLKSNVEYVSGNGTSNNPFIVKLSS